MLKKLCKSIRSSYSPVVFRYDCSLETHLELWKEKKQPKKQYLGIFFFPEHSKIILICIWILKNDYKFFY